MFFSRRHASERYHAMRWGAAVCLLWAAAVFAQNALASGKDDHDRARQAVQAGQVLPLPAVPVRGSIWMDAGAMHAIAVFFAVAWS